MTTTDFFDEKPPTPRLTGMTRQRGRRGSSALTSLVAQPAPEQAPETVSPEAPPVQVASVQTSPVQEVAPTPASQIPEAPASTPAAVPDGAQEPVKEAGPAPTTPDGQAPAETAPEQAVESDASSEPAGTEPVQDEAPLSAARPSQRQPADATRPARKTAPRPRSRATAATRPSGYQTPEQVSVYLTPEAKKKARDVARAEKIDYARLAMDAIDHALEQDVLSPLVKARLEVTRPKGSRFPTRVNLRSKSEPGARRVLWPVQLRPAEIEVLNELVTETGAEHLSTLVSVAVEAYLLDDDPETRG
ncbi:hypothetical protein [Streptosporangium sp. NPDC003464]